VGRKVIELIDITQVTPEQAASMAASCGDIQSHLKDSDEKDHRGRPKFRVHDNWSASLWNNRTGKHEYAYGQTILEAVVNVHNLLRQNGWHD